MNLWSLEYPRVAENTLNSKTSPLASTMVMPSFQSNCIWRPGGVSKRGCASGARSAPNAMPFFLQYSVKALYPGRRASGCLCSRNSWTAFFVMPGSSAFASITSRNGSKPLPLDALPSSRSPPARQYLATVLRLIPCLRPISLKLGLVPDCLYMLNSPITFLSISSSSRKVTRGEGTFVGAVGQNALALLAHLSWCYWIFTLV